MHECEFISMCESVCMSVSVCECVHECEFMSMCESICMSVSVCMGMFEAYNVEVIVYSEKRKPHMQIYLKRDTGK